MITFALNSCNRPDLLMRTIDSFLQYCDCKELITQWLIQDDSGDIGCIDFIKDKYPFFDIEYNIFNIGMLGSMDALYRRVNEPYIFQCEDDWEFYRTGFLSKSLKAFAHRYRDSIPLLQVWIRAESDTNGHPIGDMTSDRISKLVLQGYLDKFHGYSTNPGLRLKKDLPTLGLAYVANFDRHGEHLVSEHYRSLNYYAVILAGDGYVRHIGDGRSKYNPSK